MEPTRISGEERSAARHGAATTTSVFRRGTRKCGALPFRKETNSILGVSYRLKPA